MRPLTRTITTLRNTDLVPDSVTTMWPKFGCMRSRRRSLVRCTGGTSEVVAEGGGYVAAVSMVMFFFFFFFFLCGFFCCGGLFVFVCGDFHKVIFCLLWRGCGWVC